MSFNPSSPGALGLEWRPAAIGQEPLNTDLSAVGAVVRSSVTETIDALRVGHFWNEGASWRRLYADVYPLNNVGASDAETEDSFNPTSVPVNGIFISGLGTAEPWTTSTDNGATFTLLSSTGMTPVVAWTSPDTDMIRQDVNSPAGTVPQYSPVGFSFGSGSYSGAKRPLAVYFDIRGMTLGSPGLSLGLNGSRLALRRSSDNLYAYLHMSASLPSTRSTNVWPTRTFGPFYVNPFTQLPWSTQDIADFAATYSMVFETSVRAVTQVLISGVRMRVVSVPERRVAWGWGDAPAAASNAMRHDVPISLQQNNTAGSNWAKVNGTDYLVVLRRSPIYDAAGLAVPGTPSVRWIDAPQENPHRDGQTFELTIGPGGRVSSLGAMTRRSIPLWLVRTDNAQSADSQPYHNVEFLPVWNAAVASQTFTPASNRTFATVRATIGYIPAPLPNQPLQARIERVSDSVAIGGAATVTVEQLRGPLGSWQTAEYPQIRTADVVFTLSTAATLSGGVEYRVRFSSGSTSSPWLVPSMHHTNPSGVTGNVSAPGVGSTNQGASADLPVVVVDRPAPPGTFTAVVVNDTIVDPGDSRCDPGTIPHVTLTWSTTTLGSTFVAYELERDEGDGAGFQVIRRVTAENVATFNDYEMVRNVPVSYRLRVYRADGGVSAYATAGPVTAPQAAGTLHFASNVAQAGLGYVKLGTQDAWAFPEAQKPRMVELYDRDGQVALRPSEIGPTSFPFSILAWSGQQVPAGGFGRRVFKPLRDLVGNTALPYVAVLTPDGEKLNALVSITGASRRQNAKLYIASMVADELSLTPYVVEGT